MHKIITRGDDFGSFKTANRAIADAVREGNLKNVSILAIGPYWEEAVECFQELDVCLGLHLAITAEWAPCRWQPVSPPDQVASLLLEDGSFPQSVHTHFENKANVEEIMRECDAQLQRLRKCGLEIAYVDEHMGFGWLPTPDGGRVHDLIRQWAKKEGLIYDHDFSFYNIESGSPGDWAAFEEQFRNLPPEGIGRQVVHPCYPDPEIENIGRTPGEVGTSRDWQRQVVMHPNSLSIFQRYQLEPIRYDQLV